MYEPLDVSIILLQAAAFLMLLKIEPPAGAVLGLRERGRYVLCLALGEAGVHLAEHCLGSRLVHDRKGGDPDETEVDPDP